MTTSHLGRFAYFGLTVIIDDLGQLLIRVLLGDVDMEHTSARRGNFRGKPVDLDHALAHPLVGTLDGIDGTIHPSFDGSVWDWD